MVSHSRFLRDRNAELHRSVSRRLSLVKFLCERTNEAPVGFHTHAECKSLQSENDATPLLKSDQLHKLEKHFGVCGREVIMYVIVDTGVSTNCK